MNCAVGKLFPFSYLEIAAAVILKPRARNSAANCRCVMPANKRACLLPPKSLPPRNRLPKSLLPRNRRPKSLPLMSQVRRTALSTSSVGRDTTPSLVRTPGRSKNWASTSTQPISVRRPTSRPSSPAAVAGASISSPGPLPTTGSSAALRAYSRRLRLKRFRTWPG